MLNGIRISYGSWMPQTTFRQILETRPLLGKKDLAPTFPPKMPNISSLRGQKRFSASSINKKIPLCIHILTFYSRFINQTLLEKFNPRSYEILLYCIFTENSWITSIFLIKNSLKVIGAFLIWLRGGKTDKSTSLLLPVGKSPSGIRNRWDPSLQWQVR